MSKLWFILALMCIAALQTPAEALPYRRNEFPERTAGIGLTVSRIDRTPLAVKNVRRIYNFTEDVVVKGISVHDDIYTEVVFLRHILNFIVLPGDGSASRPARTCRELMIAHPKKRNGYYYIDPNGGDPADKLHAFCNFTGGGWTVLEPQVERSRMSPAELRHGLKEYDNYTWYSTMDRQFKIAYPEDNQLALLQAQSRLVRQTLTFRCARKAVLLEEYPLAAFDGRSATTVKLRGQDRVAFQAQHGATLQVDVLRNDCDEHVVRGRSVLQMTASGGDLIRFPVRDFALHNVNPREFLTVLNKATVMYL